MGGDDRKIVVYSRETSSGTYEFFKESVLKNKNYMSSSLSMPATGAIIQSVSQTKGAIGYVGLAYVSPRIKTLSVSYDGSHYATPSVENATNKTYPIVRPLYYYYNVKNKEAETNKIKFIHSHEGQMNNKKSGYIQIKKKKKHTFVALNRANTLTVMTDIKNEEAGEKKSLNFIEQAVEKDLKEGKNGG